jgi:pimeloyl-ACP methyl ester carboxylesterase
MIAMTKPVMKDSTGDGIRLRLAVWQEGEGPDVIGIHGLTANCRCWDRIAPALARHGRFVAPDLRGRGLSEKPPQGYSVAHHVRDIDHLMRRESIETAVLFGHSLGAYICLAFAARYPERVTGLILMDGGGALSADQWDHIELMIKPSIDRLGKVFPSFENYTENLKQTPVFQPWSHVLETYFQYEIEKVEGGIRSRIHPEHVQEEIANIRQTDVQSMFSQISCPVLILRATDGIFSQDDLVLPETVTEKMATIISNVRRVNIDGANHFTILFNPFQERDHAIHDFLIRLPERSGSSKER